MSHDEIERLRALCANGIDCGDNSCRFIRERSGMRTNGGCRCVRDEQKPGTISKLSAVWRAMPAALDEIERLRLEVSRLECEEASLRSSVSYYENILRVIDVNAGLDPDAGRK